MAGQTLVFKPGQIYGIVGANEAGKSMRSLEIRSIAQVLTESAGTLGKLLVKLHKPQSGSISLNGVSYEKIPRHILRQNIAYISQRPFLFDGTIRQNILVGNPRADEETGTASLVLQWTELPRLFLNASR